MIHTKEYIFYRYSLMKETKGVSSELGKISLRFLNRQKTLCFCLESMRPWKISIVKSGLFSFSMMIDETNVLNCQTSVYKHKSTQTIHPYTTACFFKMFIVHIIIIFRQIACYKVICMNINIYHTEKRTIFMKKYTTFQKIIAWFQN